jgi:hypothetical protein
MIRSVSATATTVTEEELVSKLKIVLGQSVSVDREETERILKILESSSDDLSKVERYILPLFENSLVSYRYEFYSILQNSDNYENSARSAEIARLESTTGHIVFISRNIVDLTSVSPLRHPEHFFLLEKIALDARCLHEEISDFIGIVQNYVVDVHKLLTTANDILETPKSEMISSSFLISRYLIRLSIIDVHFRDFFSCKETQIELNLTQADSDNLKRITIRVRLEISELTSYLKDSHLHSLLPVFSDRLLRSLPPIDKLDFMNQKSVFADLKGKFRRAEITYRVWAGYMQFRSPDVGAVRNYKEFKVIIDQYVELLFPKTSG